MFKVALRPAGESRWQRSSISYGRGVDNPLVVHVGLAFVRTRIRAVERLERVEVESFPRVSDQPTAWSLTFGDGIT